MLSVGILPHEFHFTNCYSEFVCILNIFFIKCVRYTTVYISYFLKDAYNFNVSVSITYSAQYFAFNWTVYLHYVFHSFEVSSPHFKF